MANLVAIELQAAQLSIEALIPMSEELFAFSDDMEASGGRDCGEGKAFNQGDENANIIHKSNKDECSGGKCCQWAPETNGLTNSLPSTIHLKYLQSTAKHNL